MVCIKSYIKTHTQHWTVYPCSYQVPCYFIAFINSKEKQGEDCGSPDRKKKTRTVFTRQQIQRLENAFDRKKYFTNSERQKLAGDLLLSETQVWSLFHRQCFTFKK